MDTAQLVRLSQSGDREAFGLLYNLYAPSMMKVIEACVHNHDIAQDILHDGFIIALMALDTLMKPAKFESWLTTIMRNLSLQYLREASNFVKLLETSVVLEWSRYYCQFQVSCQETSSPTNHFCNGEAPYWDYRRKSRDCYYLS